MELKNQVCSLEYAKQLKELGVKQESVWMWVKHPVDNSYELILNIHIDRKYKISAFTTSELGEMLPSDIKGMCIFTNRFQGKWLVGYNNIYDDDKNFEDTEADARAELLIYLLKNNLL